MVRPSHVDVQPEAGNGDYGLLCAAFVLRQRLGLQADARVHVHRVGHRDGQRRGLFQVRDRDASRQLILPGPEDQRPALAGVLAPESREELLCFVQPIRMVDSFLRVFHMFDLGA